MPHLATTDLPLKAKLCAAIRLEVPCFEMAAELAIAPDAAQRSSSVGFRMIARRR